jgi:hypothetical protein
MKSYQFAFYLFLSFPLMAQFKHDYIWLFGEQGNPPIPNHPEFGINILDFNNGELNIYREYMDAEFFVTNSSICDKNGELLFYSNGCKVFNSQNQVMQNGSGLNPGIAYSTGNCPDEGNTIPKGLIILPLPEDTTKYYIFHEAGESGEGIFNPHTAKLYYSLVDISENGGLGKVIEKNQVVLADTLHGDMHAVKHANGKDWWILVAKSTDNVIFKVLFTKEGVAGVFEQQIGPLPSQWFSSGGASSFSPNGIKYARYYHDEQLSLFDFDRATGELANFQQFYVDTTLGALFGHIAFSPNSRYVYVANPIALYQFDTEATDITATKVLVGEYDGYKYKDVLPTYFNQMQLGPDCKIYMATQSSSNTLHVIHSPNEKGTACDFRQHEFILPAVNTASIPNFPNYRLGTPYPVCDSTIALVTTAVRVPPPQQGARLWPNPASGEVHLALPAALPQPGTWSLYNGMGQRVRQEVLATGQAEHSLSVAGLPPGLYFWEVGAEGRRLGGEKVVIGRG